MSLIKKSAGPVRSTTPCHAISLVHPSTSDLTLLKTSVVIVTVAELGGLPIL